MPVLYLPTPPLPQLGSFYTRSSWKPPDHGMQSGWILRTDTVTHYWLPLFPRQLGSYYTRSSWKTHLVCFGLRRPTLAQYSASPSGRCCM